MCMCKHATGNHNINGNPGYCWDHLDRIGTHAVNPPDIDECDTLLYDEPGRCGPTIDSHSYHFRLVKRAEAIDLLVRHGGGVERHRFGWTLTLAETLAALDSNGRYWVLCAAYHAVADAELSGRTKERALWQSAAVEKRIKVGRLKQGRRRVEILDRQAVTA